MSKLQVKPQAGYTKSQSSTNPAMYPNTTVESIYWEKEHMTLEEALRNGGGGSSDVQTEMPEDGFAPNTFYNLGTITEDTTFLMAEGEEGKANHYFWVFETGSVVPQITWPEGIRLWKDNKAPVIAANQHYEISVYDGVALYIAIEMAVPMLSIPLTFEAKENNTPIMAVFDTGEAESKTRTLFYSLDSGATWQSASIGAETETLATLNAGETIQLKGDNFCPGGFILTDDDMLFYAYGNMMSLLAAENYENLDEVPSYAFAFFFIDCLVDIKPGHRLLLPATTLAEGSYIEMFYGCTSLTSAPELPATTLMASCYSNMFEGCTSLTAAPELPATTLAESCYQLMFKGCIGLTTAPELPATTLMASCYSNMFEGCTSLTAAPELPATTLAESCYEWMFHSCTNLSEVKCYAEDISAQACVSDWLSGVAATGTFTKAASVNWPTGSSGIPSGWSVVEES